MQSKQKHGHRKGIVTYIIIRAHQDDLVRDLGFGGEFGLGKRRHVDHGAAPAPVHAGFGAGAELGSFY